MENFPGFPEGILGGEICEKFRAQSLRFGTRIYSETATRVDLSSRPFHVFTGGPGQAGGPQARLPGQAAQAGRRVERQA